MANFHLTQPFDHLVQYFDGSRIEEANQLVVDQLKLAWEVLNAPGIPTTRSVNEAGTELVVEYAANSLAAWQGGARITIHGASLSVSDSDTDYSVTSIDFALTPSSAPTDWNDPLAVAVTLGLQWTVVGGRTTVFEMTSVSVEAGDISVSFVGPISFDEATGSVAIPDARFDVYYDSDPGAAVVLSHIYLEGALGYDGTLDQVSGAVEKFGLVNAGGYSFYGDGLAVTVAQLETLDPDTLDAETLEDVFLSGDDQIFGSPGADMLPGGLGNDTIDGGDEQLLIDPRGTYYTVLAGSLTVDMADYRNASGPVIVDLQTGTSSGPLGNDVLIDIEGIRGSSFADELTGNAESNVLRGGLGDDTLDGGGGTDWADYSEAPYSQTGLTVNLATGSVVGSDGGDTLVSIEAVIGSRYGDVLIGNTADNWFRIGERYYGFSGSSSDTVDGGGGFDVVSYVDYMRINFVGSEATASTTGVTVNLATAPNLTSIEGIVGSLFRDTLIGDGSANSLAGAAGNDTLRGEGGNDTLDGGDGVDTADYSTALSGVTVNLTLGTASNDGQGGADTLANIENVRGSTFADVLTGDAAANAFDGNGGVDRFIGGGGNDSYTVDAQSDLVFESLGEGTDTIISSASFYLYANVENLTLTGTALFGVGNTLANTLTGNAEQNLLIGWDGNDTIDGGAARDTIYGVEGDDTLYGQAGIDYIVGGNGNDTIYGGNDADEVYGQDGNDVIYGGDDFATDILVGGAGNDTIDGGAAWDQMYGNAGDDTFYVSQQVDWVFEQPGEGTDTVIADSPNGFYLYANIENLTLAGLTAFGVGNTLDNTLTGNAVTNVLLGGDGNDRINGKAGNDVLWGQNGVDTFVFERGTGIDNVGDFVAGADKVELSGLGYSSYGQIQSLITGTVNTVINLGQGDFAILVNVAPGTLSSTDFVFS